MPVKIIFLLTITFFFHNSYSFNDSLLLNKPFQSSVNTFDISADSVAFSNNLFANRGSIILKSDFNNNGKPDYLSVLINKRFPDNSLWIQRAVIFEKTNESWNVILTIDEKISSFGISLIKQEKAKYGYIISYDKTKFPLSINISFADKTGNTASDEAVIYWDLESNSFKLTF